ncbi:hypothetical protein MOV61_02935 [Neorhizobium sp. BETTINA12A]|uniref:hypothetical protein n=1 Tax=Neorhizobium sp. BETTINA12A TaxID=2908924 RepID=UPI001FF4D52C|nr:hypothetical protein [Neorhizobium sp. BETTINA12A]MCJ9749671.1 hypothetical protein [Neorhizobium sp. BETTINA12A]
MTIQFPVFESLSVRNYELYPGATGGNGFDFAFQADENLVLGVNGLGKSTLLLLLKQMIQGPVRLRSPGFAGERQADWFHGDANMFAVRANDGGATATAELVVRFGANRLRIQRRLRDLSLINHATGRAGLDFNTKDNGGYHQDVADLAGVGSFGDVLRLCDRVVFFLENRERLLWDWRAQYEIFRSLLLPPNEASKLRSLESQIVSADSSARNIRATMYKLRNRREKQVRKLEREEDVLAAISDVDPRIETTQQLEIELVQQLDSKRVEVADERARVWKITTDEDAAAARYAHLKYRALRHSLPRAGNEVQYLLLKIADEGHCLVCDTQGLDSMSAEVKHRLGHGQCILCGSPFANEDVSTTTEALIAQAQQAHDELTNLRAAVAEAQLRLQAATEEEHGIVDRLRRCREEVDLLQRHRRNLIGKLPRADRAQLARVEGELDNLRSSAEQFEHDREVAEAEVELLLAKLREGVERFRQPIESTFLKRGSSFFIEHIRLVYAPRVEKIAQLGAKFEFPAFEVDMTSGSTGAAFVRRTYEQASLSQREYLDIAFRMSVMESFGGQECSIVVDGPEGSVDVVFADRAGKMLAAFAETGSRVPGGTPTRQIIAACNVVEGGFIPFYLGDHSTRPARLARTIDLLTIATPTAALEQLRPEYTTKVEEVLFRGTFP